MVLFNYATRELTAKVVYYGPGLCGKTTNLQYIHQNLPQNVKGKMLSLATKTDRTLFFDFLPIDLGEIRGMKTRVQLYTVPGQVFYNETRKLVLKGADGIVFVADSQEQMVKANLESFRNLEENLKAHGMELGSMPHVIQFNKRDLPKVCSIEQLNSELNRFNAPFYESVATTGIGVQDTLKAITKLVLLHLTRKYDPKAGKAGKTVARPAVSAPPPPPVAPARPAASATTMAIPVSEAPEPVVPASPPPAPAAAPAAQAVASASAAGEELPPFGDPEIDRLVHDVQEDAAGDDAVTEVHLELDPVPTAAPAVTAATPDDRGGVEAAAAEPPPPMPMPMSMPDDEPPVTDDDEDAEQPDDAVLLTEPAQDDDLFDDPGLEVARLADGDARAIVVPVEIGEGADRRRFKLSVTLRLDAVD